MKIIDLTMLLEEDLPSDPEIQIPHIQRRDHKDTAEEMPKYFPGATMEDLPNGNGWAIDFVQMCTHSGTHLGRPLALLSHPERGRDPRRREGLDHRRGAAGAGASAPA